METDKEEEGGGRAERLGGSERLGGARSRSRSGGKPAPHVKWGSKKP
jgi:hypothetical protein